MTTGVPAIDDAIAKKKLRLYWDAAAMGDGDRAAILSALWQAVRERRDAPGTSQDERLEVRDVAVDGDGVRRVRVRYVFDNDFNSQYDKTESFEIELRVGDGGELVAVDRWEQESD